MSEIPSLVAINPPRMDSIDTRRMRDTQYAREFQTDATLRIDRVSETIPPNIVVLGLGGIGAWVALYFGRIKKVKKMILVDPDCIEDSNLNRTPFGIEDVGDLKVSAAAISISRNNPIVDVCPINRYFDDMLVEEWTSIEDSFHIWPRGSGNRDVLVIDCRDNYFEDYHFIRQLDEKFHSTSVIVRAAYNGGSITIDFCPEEHPVMGRGGYDTQPSHVFPAALSALLSVACIMNYFEYKDDSDKKYLFNNPLTFESTKILEYIFNGLYLHRMACAGDTDCVGALTKIMSGNYFNISSEDTVFVPFRDEEETDEDSRTAEVSSGTSGNGPKITQIPIHPDELVTSGIRQIRI